MASVSKVLIANLALSKLGTRSSIEDLSENSREARAVNLWYELTRQLILERHDWGFARTRQVLALDDEDAPDGVWGYRYIYPSDCLKARHLSTPRYRSHAYDYNDQYQRERQDYIPFHIEESPDELHRTILTDLEDACLVYTRDLTDPARFPRGFVLFFATQLAANIAYDLTNKGSVADQLNAQAERLYVQVAAHDANEENDDAPKDADWISGRC